MATYYVRTDGSNSNTGTTNTAGGAWLTISYAATQVIAGDIVRVQAGTYSESPTEATDGTSGSPITYVADGSVTINGAVTLSGDYIRFIGFTVDCNFAAADAITAANVTGVEVWHCTIREFTGNGFEHDGGTKVAASHRCIIIGNTFIGAYGAAGSTAESRHLALRGDNNFIAHNTFNQANEDYIYWFGTGNRFLNNYAYAPNSNSAAHVDFFQTGTDTGEGNTQTLIEANFYVDSDTAGTDHHFSNMSNGGANEFNHIILRRNVAHQIGTGVHNIFENWANVYMVHEDYLWAMRHSSQATTQYSVALMSTVENGRARNCIAWKLWGPSATTNVQGFLLEGTGQDLDYNLGFDPDGTRTFTGDFSAASQPNRIVNTDPLLTDFDNDDFSLTSSSPARNAGARLTTVTSASSSGTSFDVTDAGWFRGPDTNLTQYSGNLTQGDIITVGSTVRTISSISGNTITVTESLSWTNGDNVYWGSDTTPDLGAFPYNAGGYTLSGTISNNGSTYTVSPSDNNLVRFVIFYENGIPSSVVNSAPYTYSSGGGTVTANIFALYASKTPYVSATTGSSNNARYSVFNAIHIVEIRRIFSLLLVGLLLIV